MGVPILRVPRLPRFWRRLAKRLITVRMLMEHTSGLQNVPMTAAEIYPSPDFVQLALCAELEADPGTSYSYNNKAVNLLAGVVERASGRKLDEFARAELLRPLGIPDSSWSRDSVGNPHAVSGLALRAVDLVALGNLVLQRGAWGENRLIDETWFELALDASANEGVHRSAASFFIPLMASLGADRRSRIPSGVEAFSYSTGRHLAYRAEGDLGQWLFIFLGSELVVARLISDATVERINPSFKAPPASRQEHMRRLEPLAVMSLEALAIELAEALSEDGSTTTSLPRA